jgi:hypothetical protein
MHTAYMLLFASATSCSHSISANQCRSVAPISHFGIFPSPGDNTHNGSVPTAPPHRPSPWPAVASRRMPAQSAQPESPSPKRALGPPLHIGISWQSFEKPELSPQPPLPYNRRTAPTSCSNSMSSSNQSAAIRSPARPHHTPRSTFSASPLFRNPPFFVAFQLLCSRQQESQWTGQAWMLSQSATKSFYIWVLGA